MLRESLSKRSPKIFPAFTIFKGMIIIALNSKTSATEIEAREVGLPITFPPGEQQRGISLETHATPARLGSPGVRRQHLLSSSTQHTRAQWAPALWIPIAKSCLRVLAARREQCSSPEPWSYSRKSTGEPSRQSSECRAVHCRSPDLCRCPPKWKRLNCKVLLSVFFLLLLLFQSTNL